MRSALKGKPGQRAVLTAALAKKGIDPRELGRTFARRGTPTDAPDLEDITIPDTREGLEDLLNHPEQLQRILVNKRFPEFVNKYASEVLKDRQDVATQVRDLTEKTLADWLRDNASDGVMPINLGFNNRDAVVNEAHARAGLYEKRAMGAALDREYTGATDYFRTIWHNGPRDSESQRKLYAFRNAFSSNVPSEGGFLIPETLRSEMLRVSLETSIVRPRARVIPMETLRVPIPAIDSTSNVSSVYGGIVGYWTEEGAALTQSSAAFGRVVLDAKKLTAYTEVPNELLSDSGISFEAFIRDIFPEALGFYEDDAFINGGGVGEPLGVLNAAGAIEVAKESGQTADTVVWQNVIKAFSRMLPSSLNRAIWIASIDTFVELATMALTVGTGGSAVWLNNGAEGPPATILGRPVVFSEKVPSLGNAGDLNFIDFGFYLIGDRQAMSTQSSADYKFGNDVTAFRVIERVDGRPWLMSPITPKNGGATLSPYVKIAERG